MSSLPSPYECNDSCCHDPTCLDLQITPHSASDPVSISYPKDHKNYQLLKEMPPVLRNKDAGLSKIPRRDIFGYIPVHYDREIKPSNTRFLKTDPARLGQKLVPGCGPKPLKRKDLNLKIVPDDISPRQNKRAQNQWLWQREQSKKEVQRMMEFAGTKMEEDVRRGKAGSRRDSVMSVAVSFV